MQNLKEETLNILNEHGKSINDIEWIGMRNVEIPIATFLDLADVEYDDGFGLPEVDETLIVVGGDWWLERAEYDGSEWWEFKTLPKRPDEIMDVKRIVYT